MSDTFDDSNHPVRFISPLAGDLVVRSMTGDEALGRLFCYNLELLSRNLELQFSDIVGQKVTVVLTLADGERYFNGYITEFRYMGHTDRYARYQATLRPWFWFLTRTSDCKIFQEMKVPDIIKAVFRDNGMPDFEDRLSGTYRDWEYCVQYRETDFNFISRLMEQEGIYYFFEHQDGNHVLILADDTSAHNAFPNFENIPYYSPHDGVTADDDHLQFWAVTQSIQPEHYAIQDFDFKKPRTDLIARLNEPGTHAYPLDHSEIYDYPGEYSETGDGEKYVGIRLEELRGQMERVSAGGPCRGLSAGCKFNLENYPRDDQNKEYLVVFVSHQISDGTYISSGGAGAEELYLCQAELMEFGRAYRHVRGSPKPIVQGPQTAIVVGPEDEEIYTDEFGRVKVQFHWDRYGGRDENSSCWVRVSQYWAGAKWGSIHIPRIGQEVIVSFMEGDPDKPVVTGRLYNAVNMPPYDLPQDKTQSGVKTRSTKDGTANNFNELQFEDKKGAEKINLHAEKDLNTSVENNETRTTDNTRTVTVGESDNHRPAETIESLQVFGKRIIDIRGDDGLTVSTGAHGRFVDIQDGDYQLKVQKGHYKLDVDLLNAETKVKIGDFKVSTDVGNIKLMSPVQKTTIDAGTGIEFTCGGSSIVMTPASIEIKSGASSITITPAGIISSAPIISSSASAAHSISGGATVSITGGIVTVN